MSRFYEDFVTPPASPARIADWAKGLNLFVEQDWEAAQKNRNPVQSLAWNAHDQDLQNIVGQYNEYLAGTPGYQGLNWLLVKAMLFVETNARNNHWPKEPMQSANLGDLGYGALMSDPSKLDLIVPQNLRSNLQFPNMDAANNITAGVGYLLMRAAEFGYTTTVTDQFPKSVTVQKGDTLDSIASKVHSTPDVIKKLNPFVDFHLLKPGTVLQYQTAQTKLTITGWRTLTPDSIYSLYNANGRGVYGEELAYAYDLIKRNKFLQ